MLRCLRCLRCKHAFDQFDQFDRGCGFAGRSWHQEDHAGANAARFDARTMSKSRSSSESCSEHLAGVPAPGALKYYVVHVHEFVERRICSAREQGATPQHAGDDRGPSWPLCRILVWRLVWHGHRVRYHGTGVRDLRALRSDGRFWHNRQGDGPLSQQHEDRPCDGQRTDGDGVPGPGINLSGVPEGKPEDRVADRQR